MNVWKVVQKEEDFEVLKQWKKLAFQSKSLEEFWSVRREKEYPNGKNI